MYGMPIVRIEARRGLDRATKARLLQATHDALVIAFRIPDDDRAQRFVEYEAADFEIPPGKGPRYTIVEITAFAGRSIDAKRSLYREIATRFDAAGVPATDVLIVLKEEPAENWGLRGGRAACDVDLGFDIII
jgi:phenylpyruvate tautomerase PptA (4-oxalocrotonate tautomerase family)